MLPERFRWKDFEPYPFVSHNQKIRESAENLEASLTLAAASMDKIPATVEMMVIAGKDLIKSCTDQVLLGKLELIFNLTFMEQIISDSRETAYFLNDAAKEAKGLYEHYDRANQK